MTNTAEADALTTTTRAPEEIAAEDTNRSDWEATRPGTPVPGKPTNHSRSGWGGRASNWDWDWDDIRDATDRAYSALTGC